MKKPCSRLVAIGEATLVGAGMGMALIGAVEIAAAITVHPWVAIARHYDDCLFIFGGMVGAAAGWLSVERQPGRPLAPTPSAHMPGDAFMLNVPTMRPIPRLK
jgi:hypothetical protein